MLQKYTATGVVVTIDLDIITTTEQHFNKYGSYDTGTNDLQL